MSRSPRSLRLDFLLSSFLTVFLILSGLGSALAQAPSLSEPVGQTSPIQTATLTFLSAGSPANVGPNAVLTLGAPNLDFQFVSSTCSASFSYIAGNTCMVSYTFQPTAPGLRLGAVVLYDGNGNLLAQTPIHGLGTGAQAVFPPSTATGIPLAGNFGQPAGIAVDGFGNVFVTDNATYTASLVPVGCTAVASAQGQCTVTAFPQEVNKGTYGLLGAPSIDGAGNVFLGLGTPGTAFNVARYSAACASASGAYACVESQIETAIATATVVTLDGNQNLLAFSPGGYLQRGSPICAAPGTAACELPPSGLSTLPGELDPGAAAVDADGDLFVLSGRSVYEIPASGCSANCPILMAGAFAGYLPESAIAVDPAGDIYAVNAGAPGITFIPAGCTAAAQQANQCNTTVFATTAAPAPAAIAIDSAGNLYILNQNSPTPIEIPMANPSSLSLPQITVGQTTSATFPVANIGNAPLEIVGLGSSSPNFSLASAASGTAPVCTDSLAPGAFCGLSATFTPQTNGNPLTGLGLLTDNNLAGSGVVQQIPLSASTPGPKVTAITPNSGPTGGGNQISLTGTGFLGTKSVLFSAPATFTVLSDTLMQTVAPAGEFGTQPVFITTPSGSISVNYQYASVSTTTSVVALAQQQTVGLPVQFNITAAVVPSWAYYSSPGSIVVDFGDGTTPQTVSAPLNNTISVSHAYLTTGSLPASYNVTATYTSGSSNVLPSSATSTVQIVPLQVNTLTDDATGVAANCSYGSATPCTLRDAIAVANSAAANPPGLPITFASSLVATANQANPAAIVLTGGVLALNGNMVITGPTSGSGASLANLLAIDGAGATQIFTIPAPTTAINHLILRNGNSGSAPGGAINHLGLQLGLDSDTFTGNTTTGNGGAIQANGVAVTITNSTFANNSAASGGAIYNDGSQITAVNSTFYGNLAATAALFQMTGRTTLINSTVSGNTSAAAPGGLYFDRGNAALYNSIVAGNAGTMDVYGAISANTGSLIGSASTTSPTTPTTPTTVNTFNLALSPLGYYGGPTQTLLPQPGSSAFCYAQETIPSLTISLTDQRGATQANTYCPAGSMDAGAVQTTYALSFTRQPVDTPAFDWITPSPIVDVVENGLPRASVPVSIAAASGTVTGSSAQTTGADGTATFGSLSIAQAESNDTLIASLALGSFTASLPATPIAATAVSTPFNVLPNTPTVTGIAPPNGNTSGGYPVTVYGTNFTPASTVSFGGTPAPVSASTTTTLTVTAPPGYGSVDVTVNNGYATSASSSADRFTYNPPAITSIAPSYGAPSGGVAVTITGSNFLGATQVYFGTVPATSFTVVIPNLQIIATAPPQAAGAVPVTVASPGGVSNGATFFYGIQSYTVTTLTDDAAGLSANCIAGATPAGCSLRDAIAAANSLPNGVSSTITFAPSLVADATQANPAVYSVATGGTLTIIHNTTITGPTTGSGASLANLLAIDGAGATQIFNVAGTVFAGSINNVIVRNGYTSQGPAAGLEVTGVLTLNADTFTGNVNAGTSGAAIAASSQARVTISNSTFTQNAAGSGGTIANGGANLTFVNSTLAGNTGGGGALYQSSGSTTFIGSTVSGNNGGGSPGGANILGGSLSLYNSIVAGNTSGNRQSDLNASPTVSVASIVNVVNNGNSTINPNLSTLDYHGGPTRTLVPIWGSSAICAAQESIPNLTVSLTDQRGVTQANAYCPAGTMDIGAVQTSYSLGTAFTVNPPATIGSNGVVYPNPAVTATENGLPATYVGWITLTAATGIIADGSNTAAPVSSGLAVFDPSITGAQADDTLTATMQISPLASPITVTSTPFSSLLLITTTLASGEVGVAYAPTQLGAANGTQPYTFSATSLPSGMILSASGTLYGTPNASGSSVLSVTVTDANGVQSSQTLSLTIVAAPVLTATTPTNLVYGTPVTPASIASVSGGSGSGYVFTQTGLPIGLTLSSAGILSGTPQTAGNFSVTIHVTDGAGGLASSTITITVAAEPTTITLAPLAAINFSPESQYIIVTATLSSTSSIPISSRTVTFSLLSNGNVVASSTASTGVNGAATVELPIASGTQPGNLTVQAAFNGGTNFLTPTPATQTLTINGIPPTISSANNVSFPVLSSGSFQVMGSGTPAAIYSFTGSLPAGLTFSSTGLLSGTALTGTVGSYPITITATNGVSPSAIQSFTITITPIAPTLSLSIPTQAYSNTPLSPAASTNSNGTVSYSIVSGPASSSGSSLQLTGTGSVTVKATLAASGNYTAATTQATFNVTPAALTVAIIGTPTKLYDATTKATLTSANYAVNGLVGSDKITVTQATATYQAATAGSELVSATLGAANFAATSGSLANYILPAVAIGPGAIAKATPVVTWATPTAITYGTALSAAQLNAKASVAGAFAYTPAHGTLAAGSQPLSVIFTPTDAVDYNAQTAGVTLVVKKATSTTTFAVTTTQTVTGTTVTITATVAPQISGTPTGTVTYFDGTTSLGSAAVGTPFTTPLLNVGSNAITVTYSGDTNFLTSTSAASTVTGVAPTTVQLDVPLPTVIQPFPVIYAVVIPLKNLQLISGTITMYDGNTSLCTTPILPGGIDLGLLIPPLSVGTHQLRAVYSGNANYPAGQSSVVTVTVLHP